MRSPPRRRQKLGHESMRKSAGARGYGSRWAKYSRKYRTLHPICIACEDYSRTEMVDHIIPVNGPNDPLFWPGWNHQPLCRKCHAQKTENHDASLRANRAELLDKFDGTRDGLLRAAGLKIAAHSREE